MNDHAGRIAVITGAVAGIGQAIAVELARPGADSIAVDIASADETVSAVRASGQKAPSLQRTFPIP